MSVCRPLLAWIGFVAPPPRAAVKAAQPEPRRSTTHEDLVAEGWSDILSQPGREGRVETRPPASKPDPARTGLADAGRYKPAETKDRQSRPVRPPDPLQPIRQRDLFEAPESEAIPDRPPPLAHLNAGMAETGADFGPRGHRGRMREKLLARGADALADYELLEMLLFFAFKQGDTKPLAKLLIHTFGSFGRVLTAKDAELMAVRGVGVHAVAAIRLVQAAALRLQREEVLQQPVLNNWDKLMGYLNAQLARERVEQFHVLFLDGRNRLLADEAQARGTVNHTPVYPREVVKRALELHATALILVHNHPSGDPTPSRDDIEIDAPGAKTPPPRWTWCCMTTSSSATGAGWSFRQEGLLG